MFSNVCVLVDVEGSRACDRLMFDSRRGRALLDSRSDGSLDRSLAEGRLGLLGPSEVILVRASTIEWKVLK